MKRNKEQVEFGGLIGKSLAFRNVIEVAKRVAVHDVPVLIEGETGTGKESLARAIHFASPRAEKGDFIALDCSDFTETFLESELFGYVRGSFAGAIHDKKGFVELAENGTLYLNHISHLSSHLQGKLLKMLNDRIFYKIGGVAAIETEARLIAGINQDLKILVSQRKFREDLYYQLNVMKLTIPPLRERKDDISLLADYFLADEVKKNGFGKKEFTDEAKTLLESYSWPGNLDEMRKEIERAVILSGDGNKIGSRYFSEHVRSKKQISVIQQSAILGAALKDQKKKVIAELEREAIRNALIKTEGNRTQAAKLLSISRQELIRKIAHYNIKD